MVEPIMYMGIGFLLAGLLVIGVIPLVHARAVRLTMKRLEALTPMSMAEIQADKDQLRAEFAMSTRRLEMNVEQMKAKVTSQLAEIGKRSEAVGRLKLELGEKTAAIFALEAKEQKLLEDLHRTEQELAERNATLAGAERALAETRLELTKVNANFNDASLTTDSQRVELMALRAQVEVLKGQIDGYEKEATALHDHIARMTAELESSNAQLVEARIKGEGLVHRVSELDRQLLAQTTEAETLARRVQELTSGLDEQGQTVANRDYATDQPHSATAVAQKTEADLRAKLADLESRMHITTEGLNAEKLLLERQLKQADEDRSKLEHELEAMKQEAEAAWAAERMENAVMRERISDVAAEMARLTSVLEGPGSPIEAILSGESGRAHAALNGNGHDAIGGNGNGEGGSKGSLADRIRALQDRASRAPQAGRQA